MAAEISSTHVAMKDAFIRYDDGKPFYRDLKVMEILEGIDKEMNSNIVKLPQILKFKRKR